MCQHLHTVVDFSGGMSFSAYGVSDTITERVICVDCGNEVEIKPEPVQLNDLEPVF